MPCRHNAFSAKLGSGSIHTQAAYFATAENTIKGTKLMGTTREEIKSWLDRGKEKGASHVIVATDTFDWEDYPVFVQPGQSAEAEVTRLRGQSMTKVMEAYDLGKSIPDQLAERRVFNL